MDNLSAKYVQIYTDWANHYLQKAGKGNSITDLQKDVRNGVLLAEVIQSVSGDVIHGILPTPTHDGEALENISACLEYLDRKGVNVQNIQPQDILEGNLKCILTLFYGLSRLKQRNRVNNSANCMNNNDANNNASSATNAVSVSNGAASSSLSHNNNATRTSGASTAEVVTCSRALNISNPPRAAVRKNTAAASSSHQKNNNCNNNSSISTNSNGNLVKNVATNSKCTSVNSTTFHEHNANVVGAAANCENSIIKAGGSQYPQSNAAQGPVVSKQHSQQQKQLSELSQRSAVPGFVSFSAGYTVPPVNATSKIINTTCASSNTVVCTGSQQLVGTQQNPVTDSELQQNQSIQQYHCQQPQNQLLQQHPSSIHNSKTSLSSISPVGFNRNSCNFTPPNCASQQDANSSRPNSRCAQQVSNKSINRQLSEITESDCDYGYSCGSEVYQSISGAQLWSPSHTSRQCSSVSSTPTKQLGRASGRTVDNSAPVVPSYYLRSLSPPPVVDHYSTGGESRKQAKGISRLFAGRESKKRKTQIAAATSGSISEGEASSARYSVQPKSPLKAAFGKAFGSKTQSPTAVSETSNDASRKNQSATAKIKTSVSSQNSETSAVNMSQVQSQLPRRMPDQTHNPLPPHTGIPQPKSRTSPNRLQATSQSASGIPAPGSTMKSPQEARRGIPQPGSRPKSPANFNSTSNLSKVSSKVPASSGKIPTSARSKSPGCSLIGNSSSAEKDESRRLRPIPEPPKQKTGAEPEQNVVSNDKSDNNSSVPTRAKTDVSGNQPRALSQNVVAKQHSENAQTSQSLSPKSHLPTSGIRPPGSATGRASVGRSTSGQYGRLKQGIQSGSSSNLAPKAGHNTDNSQANENVTPEKQFDKGKTHGGFTDPETEEQKVDTTLVGTEVKTDPVASNNKPSIETTFHASGDTTSTSSTVGCPPQQKNVVATKIASPPQKQYKPSGIVTRSGSAASRLGRPGKVYGATRVPANASSNVSDTYGYVTDTDVISACSSYVEGDQSDCVTLTPTNDTNTCQVTGYMSESGELAPTPPARATLSPASVAPLRYHQHSQQTTRVFKDGISAIRDCLQRSDIQLADSDSEGDVESVTSNISDLVNDLSSDISANITSPSDLSKSKSSSLNPSPAAAKTLQHILHQQQHNPKESPLTHNLSLNNPGNDSAFKDHSSPLGVQKPARKTAIVQPQIPNMPERPPSSHQLLCEAIRKSQEDLLMYSSADSSPLLSQKKSADGRSNATIKRCPASKTSMTQPQDIDKVDHGSNETMMNKLDKKIPPEIASPTNAIQQPLIGQIRGNVFRLSSVSSAVSEEHEDARSDDCQRHSGGSFQNSELTNSRESLTVLHSRNQMSAAASLMMGSPGVGSSPSHALVPNPHPQQRRHLSPSNRRQIPPQIESDIEWDSTSINSTRTNSFISTHDKSCFSDTEDFAVKPRDPHSSLNPRVLANNPAMRRFLESRAAQGRNPNSRNPSVGSDYLESSFALMDIRNLREKLANPHNIDTQSDYGVGSSTLSRSRSGRLDTKQEQEADSLLEKFSLLNSMSPRDQSIENIRNALSKQYANLPLTQELLNKSSGLAPGSSISPSSMSTASATGSLTVDPNPKHRYSAISDINPRSLAASSLYNTPVLGMKSPRSGSSTLLYAGSQSSKGSNYLPPELTLNHASLSNALGELANLGRDDQFLCGSNMSLNSASSFDSAHIESQTMQETIRRLKNELILSNEKVSRLTSHIICNAQTVASFEKTLASLNHKLSQMLLDGRESTANEIENLKNLIERLKMLQKTDLLSNSQKELRDPTAVSKSRDNHVRASSLDAASFLSTGPPNIKQKVKESSSVNNTSSASPNVEGGSEKTSASDDCANDSLASNTSPQLSGEKMHDKKAKKNWLRSTFKLGRKKSPGRVPVGGGTLSASDVEEGGPAAIASGSVPSSPFHKTATFGKGFPSSASPTSNSTGNSSSLPRMQLSNESALVIGGKEEGRDLKQKLHENEKKLTETKLQYLSSAHQIDQMKDEMSILKSELDMLRNENEKLTSQTTSSSRCSPSNSSATSSNCMACRHSSCESCSASDLQHSNSDLCLSVLLDNTISSANLHVLSANSHDKNSLKIIRIKIKLGNPKDELEPQACSFYVGTVGITTNTQWFMIDIALSKIFADYLSRIDNSNLGLSAESLKFWSAGKDLCRSTVVAGTEESLAENEVSPFNYFESDSVHGSSALPGSTTSIDLTLKDHADNCCDTLVFETCIPKQHLQLYFNQWAEFKKLIFIGPPGTGKSYLSLKMAHHIVSEMGLTDESKTIQHLNMDLEGISELRETVIQIIKHSPTTGPASENGKRNTRVLFIENVHSLGSQISEALSILSNLKINLNVFVIATMTSQSNQSYPQLQKVFPRWVVLSNHNEPISGLVGRYLRRQLLEFENRNGGIRAMHLAHIIDWIPKVWKHVNRLIEKYNSAEVTLGPHLFLSCPIDPTLSQSWFNNLWNYSLAPYLMEAIRDGLQLYGAKSGTLWEDPTTWVEETYPWSPSGSKNKQSSVSSSPSRSSTGCCTSNYNPSLIRIRKEDVGFDKVCRSLGIETTSSSTSYDNTFSISQ